MTTITNSALEQRLLDLIFTGNSLGFVAPTTLYFALLDVNGTEITNGTTYPRTAFICNPSNFFDTSGGTNPVSSGNNNFTSNNGPIRWPKPVANYTARFVAVYDAPTGGNLLWAIPTSYSGQTSNVYGPQIYTEGFVFALGSYDSSSPAPFPISRHTRNKVIDFLFRGNSASWNGNTGSLYLALMTHEYDGLATPTEVSTALTGYARQPIQCDLTNGWDRPTVNTLRNKNLIEFPPVTATYGDITGYALFDAATGGNMVWSCPWNNPQRVEYGDERPRVPVGTLEIALDIVDAVV